MKMTKMMKKTEMVRMKSNSALGVFSLSLIVFVGCDYIGSRALDRERSDSIYRAAMDDYAAGRVDKAVAGLERVVCATPGNASARFQLACLLQDVKKDYLGALCNYREFMAQDKTGEKSGLAKDRIVQCERLLGPELTKKYSAGDDAAASRNAELAERVVELGKANKDLEKRLERALAKAEAGAKDLERMRRMLTGEVSEDSSRPVIMTETALLDDEDESPSDRIRVSEDVKNLLLDGDEEKSDAPFEVSSKPTKSIFAKKDARPEPPHEPRPAEYVVQDGDTLYKLAVRFYGLRSAWQKIRDANKTTISTDGRIRTGQKIVLP